LQVIEIGALTHGPRVMNVPGLLWVGATQHQRFETVPPVSVQPLSPPFPPQDSSAAVMAR